jgi:hypothetical protein
VQWARPARRRGGRVGPLQRHPAEGRLDSSRIGTRDYNLREDVALLRSELVEARGLLIALGQSATAVQIETAEIVLASGIALLRRTFIEANSLAVVLRQAAAPLLIKEPKINLRQCEVLVGGELIEA